MRRPALAIALSLLAAAPLDARADQHQAVSVFFARNQTGGSINCVARGKDKPYSRSVGTTGAGAEATLYLPHGLNQLEVFCSQGSVQSARTTYSVSQLKTQHILLTCTKPNNTTLSCVGLLHAPGQRPAAQGASQNGSANNNNQNSGNNNNSSGNNNNNQSNGSGSGSGTTPPAGNDQPPAPNASTRKLRVKSDFNRPILCQLYHKVGAAQHTIVELAVPAKQTRQTTFILPAVEQIEFHCKPTQGAGSWNNPKSRIPNRNLGTRHVSGACYSGGTLSCNAVILDF